MKKTLIAAALTAIVSTGIVATTVTPVLAGEAQTKATQNNTDKQKTNLDLIKVSDDALMTMRNIGSARLAIFNGLPGKAQVYTDAAVTRVSATLKDAEKFAMDIKRPMQDGEKFVPFNASLTVIEALQPDKVKSENIEKANKHLHNGETKKAMETLKVGGINVALSTELMPVNSAKSHIEKASSLIKDGKYYEANLELKAVESEVVNEMYDTSELPTHKAKSDKDKS